MLALVHTIEIRIDFLRYIDLWEIEKLCNLDTIRILDRRSCAEALPFNFHLNAIPHLLVPSRAKHLVFVDPPRHFNVIFQGGDRPGSFPNLETLHLTGNFANLTWLNVRSFFFCTTDIDSQMRQKYVRTYNVAKWFSADVSEKALDEFGKVRRLYSSAVRRANATLYAETEGERVKWTAAEEIIRRTATDLDGGDLRYPVWKIAVRPRSSS